jgi:hypothetical protein
MPYQLSKLYCINSWLLEVGNKLDHIWAMDRVYVWWHNVLDCVTYSLWLKEIKGCLHHLSWYRVSCKNGRFFRLDKQCNSNSLHQHMTLKAYEFSLIYLHLWKSVLCHWKNMQSITMVDLLVTKDDMPRTHMLAMISHISQSIESIEWLPIHPCFKQP